VASIVRAQWRTLLPPPSARSGGPCCLNLQNEVGGPVASIFREKMEATGPPRCHDPDHHDFNYVMFFRVSLPHNNF
jgi:hypothetical protein